jgi:PAS domain S-box-containing protein
MNELSALLGRSGFLPHGYCFTWAPGLLWTMVVADAVIAAAYFSIPMALVSFARRRNDGTVTNWVIGLFGAFIVACGVTHLMDIWTIWQPDYAWQAVSKLVTAGISALTAVMLWPLIPKALKIPSISHLQDVIQALEAEVARRHTAEEHLAEMQQSLAVTLSSIGAGFLATDREGRITRMNAVAEQVLGWTQAEAQGCSYWQVFVREGRPPEFEARNPVEVMIEGRWDIDTAHQVTAVSRLGVRTPLEVKAALARADDGSARGIVVVFRDMTEQLQAEVEVGRIAAIVESSNDAIIGKTLDGRITSWNRAAERMFGYSAQEAVGQPVQMLIPSEREVEEMRILASLAHGDEVPAFDTVRRAKDGRVLNVSLSISPIRDRRGRIIGASKIVRDVTEERRTEAARRQSEARLRFTLESAQIGDWSLDTATGAMQRSARHDRCFGYAELQPEWTFHTTLAHVHPDDREELQRQFQGSLAALGDWGAECRVVWPDGSLHWISLHGSLRLEEGRPTQMLGIVSDITPQKLAEEARLTAERLESENRQIQEASRLKSLFLANMSHELRTPLNAVIGFADLLRSGAVPAQSPKHHEYLGHIGSSGRHLLQLINDVLDLSKVESGKFEFFPEPLDLGRLVQEALDVLHTAVTRKRIRVLTDIAPGLGGIVLDAGRLKQALYNYLSNAIKFTPEGGEVQVRARAEGPDHFRLEVQDNGIGISPEDQARLFVEFQQLDNSYSKRHQGTGLGLALTRRLVQAQGGRVGVASAPGQGSVFHLVLPRVYGSASTLPQDAPAAPVPAPAGIVQRLLVIDGDLAKQARLVQALRAAGFEVDAAATGAQALQQALSQTYGAFTLDLVLPDQGGLAVLERIRGTGASRSTPVVGMGVVAAPGLAAHFAVADVLSKPIRTAEVVSAMSRLRRASPGATRVLVIDDDPLALDLMQATLGGLGLAMAGVLDGRQALRELDLHRPDAIILDLMMPGFDGFAVLDELRRLPDWCDTPVFIWTSMVLNDEEIASLMRSAAAILQKGGGAMDAVLERLRLSPLPAVNAPGTP